MNSEAQLVVGDTNATNDIFVRDMLANTTIRVSVDSVGVESNGVSTKPAISGDGLVIAFESAATNLIAADTNGNSDVFVHTTVTGVTVRASESALGIEGDNSSSNGSGNAHEFGLSEDGRYIAFSSNATNLVAGDTNGGSDAFIKDIQTGAITRLSVSAALVEGDSDTYDVSINGDGRFVVFSTDAENLTGADTNGSIDIKNVYVPDFQ